MKNKVLWLCFLILFSMWGSSHPLRKRMTIVRITEAPRIDANPGDKVWELAVPITDFIQYSPVNGGEPSQRTEVRMLYDNEAIYVLAILYDSSPDSIFRELGERDSGNEANADLFSLEMNPDNNGLHNVEFMVSAAGVQMDSKNSLDSMFKSWDAVWKSEVAINRNGWIAEMEIPFSAIRFPSKEVQLWEINFYRLIKRRGEGITWNFVDRNKKGWLNQAGELHGLANLNPPVRLSLMPYATAYYNRKKMSFKGGMDIKYGLNESYTLDMMLIPDFGQIRGDDHVLNLSVVETKYDEKRQFFTEGRELFNRGDIFYSRRIGGIPMNHDSVQFRMTHHEVILQNPLETNLFNASKISGHSSSGWGFGLLNAITRKQEALVQDTITGLSRNITTQDVSNYNLLVVNRDIGKESFLSWVNSNVLVPETKYMANVSGFDFKYRFKHHALFSKAFMSYHHNQNRINDVHQFGHRIDLQLSKLTGVIRYSFENKILSNTYNPRDFGYLEYNNLVMNMLRLQYFRYAPSKRTNEVTGELDFYLENLYNPFSYSRFEISGFMKLLFPGLDYLRVNFTVSPFKKFDHFEPRTEGWKFMEPAAVMAGAEYSSDFRKRLAFRVSGGFMKASQYGKQGANLMVQPQFRVSDRLSLGFISNLNTTRNAIGYVTRTFNADSIYFGRRNMVYSENVVSVKYSFSNKSALNIRLRHYWSNVGYKSFYLLRENGGLCDVRLPGEYNANVNHFNSDITYFWQFLPGSEVRFVWKNYYSRFDRETKKNYFKNLENVFSYMILNSLSVRIIYYIDYKMIRRLI